MKPQSHHNTTNLSGADLFSANERAISQEEAILEMFKRHPTGWPRQEIEKYFPHWPTQSIVRALSNLSNPKKRWGAPIEKTSETMIGKYGAKVHYWKLKI